MDIGRDLWYLGGSVYESRLIMLPNITIIALMKGGYVTFDEVKYIARRDVILVIGSLFVAYRKIRIQFRGLSIAYDTSTPFLGSVE